MPKCYSLAACAAALALFAAPAFADGYPGRPVQKGPAPLKAHTTTQPAPGCELIGGSDWYCPPSETVTRRYVDESQTRQYVRRYTTGGACCTPALTCTGPFLSPRVGGSAE